MSNPISNFFSKLSLLEWIVLLLMILVGILSRAYLSDYPNFKPIAAFILMGGFLFRNWLVVLVAMLTVMFLTDYRIATYEWSNMVANYASLAIAVLLGVMLRRTWGVELRGWSWVPGFAVASVLMSVTFFLLSNGAVWLFADYYPKTWSGLMTCYQAGLPFFRGTLLGDLCFTMATVGIYYVARNLWPVVGAKPVQTA